MIEKLKVFKVCLFSFNKCENQDIPLESRSKGKETMVYPRTSQRHLRKQGQMEGLAP